MEESAGDKTDLAMAMGLERKETHKKRERRFNH